MEDWRMTLFLAGMAALLIGLYMWNYRVRKRLEAKMFGTKENPDRNPRHFPWESRVTVEEPLTEKQLEALEKRLSRTEGIFVQGRPGERELCLRMRQPFSPKALKGFLADAGCGFREMTEAKMRDGGI